MTSAAEHYDTWPAVISALREEAPDTVRAFGTMFQKLMAPGALSARDKELIALAVGMALRCEPCIYSHTEKAVKAGATREQIMEMAGVVVMMQGGPGYVYMPKLMDALDALGVEWSADAAAPA